MAFSGDVYPCGCDDRHRTATAIPKWSAWPQHPNWVGAYSHINGWHYLAHISAKSQPNYMIFILSESYFGAHIMVAFMHLVLQIIGAYSQVYTWQDIWKGQINVHVLGNMPISTNTHYSFIIMFPYHWCTPELYYFNACDRSLIHK